MGKPEGRLRPHARTTRQPSRHHPRRHPSHLHQEPPDQIRRAGIKVTKPKKITQWNRLDDSPKRSRRSSLGRLTSVDSIPPQYLTPLTVTYERVSRSETVQDPITGEAKKTR